MGTYCPTSKMNRWREPVLAALIDNGGRMTVDDIAGSVFSLTGERVHGANIRRVLKELQRVEHKVDCEQVPDLHPYTEREWWATTKEV